MPIMNGCCCFVKLRNGSRASAVFTAITGLLNIIINIWMLVKLHAMEIYLERNERQVWMPPGIIVFIYIELVCNIGNLGLAMLLWIGINFGYEGKNLIFSWVYGMSAFRFYHFFLMMYVLIWIGGHRISDIVYVVPETLLVTMYWILNTFILVAALLCVVSYWQELIESLYGKEKRRRRFYKITNIRQAHRFPGTVTPSLYGSKATLAMSRQSSYAPSQPSVKPSHTSVSSGSLPYKA
ncbi:hypothetical protein LSH36_174g05005 [Paralvinella palmiformis]|uniref:Transmembrane protein n=1 Tax=Paralvinella palmiformis TaxID=53620 RepID=A0AAD9N8P9_9ANNE|nr:hypothetical protein LSH36_174g05005 [Paralvinella palmiformis]